MVGGRLAAAAGFLALAGLAACGGSTPSAARSPGTSATPSATASPQPTESPAIGCTIVTADTVNAALGTTVGVPTVDHPSPAETDCTYNGNGEIVTVDIIVGENAAGFVADQQTFTAGQTWASAPGIGDQAYYVTKASSDGTTTILFALKGTNSFVVSSQTSLASVETLMNQIIAGT
jgi:hypothetical protein